MRLAGQNVTTKKYRDRPQVQKNFAKTIKKQGVLWLEC